MDPFSGESELLTITSAFYTHAYTTVLDYDTSQLSPANRPVAQTLQQRARIALGQTDEIIVSLSKSKDAAARALVALAQQTQGKTAQALETALALADSDADDATVQICAGSVLASNAEYSKAVELLSKHQGNLEAVALMVQIYLAQNRTDLALKEVQGAKRWAQDSLLINLAEAWTNLRVGGGEKYQSAFYVYEELASTPGNTSPTALVGQAISELHLGRVEEAEVALNNALQQGGDSVDIEALSNSIVLASMMGKKADAIQELVAKLKARDPGHALLVDVKEKSDLFDAVATKYGARVAS